MGGNKSSKIIVGGIVGAVTLGGVIYYFTKESNDSRKANHREGFRHQNQGNRTPSPDGKKCRPWSEEEKEILEDLKRQLDTKKAGQEGEHLEPGFYGQLQDLMYLRTREKVDQTMKAANDEIVSLFNAFKFADFHKQIRSLTEKKSQIEEDEIDCICDMFQDPAFIQASRIYLIRYNPDELIKILVIGSRLKHRDNLKMVNQFNVSTIVQYLKKKISSRIEQGFECVDPLHFPTEFWLQMNFEVRAKFDASLDEFWAFCALESLGGEQQLWDDMIAGYCKMLKTFYHSMGLYTPGIKITK